ncbi:MAG TPA: thiamine phosphate synthase [Candidatus Coprocola pullicola]|nr:thiamine phosphate synthase [Candidatus Coprocola pullicola]
MIMSTFKKIAITNRALCSIPFLEQIENIAPKVDIIILREKDLAQTQYQFLAKEVITICQKYHTNCILHTYIEVAKNLQYKKIHMPLPLLEKHYQSLQNFQLLGASVHSVQEAQKAQYFGANYIVAGHIFQTDCKKDLPPKGVDFLKEICRSVSIPVYALGGINDQTEALIYDSGVSGACRMSDYMKC